MTIMQPVSYQLVKTAEEYADAQLLFHEYADSLAIDLQFQGFQQEMETLQLMYAPPSGAIILARVGNQAVACIGLRKLSGEVGEIKRMYVRPSSQKLGIGRGLLERVIVLARERGYKSLQLDTLREMKGAIRLYRQAGFYEIPAYYHNPNAGALYFQLKL